MLKKLVYITLVTTIGFAGDLTLSKGVLKAHTEVFGDSTIDPETTAIESKLKMDESINSLSGEVLVSMVDLKSDNDKRDSHMMETLETSKYAKAIFQIKDVKESKDGYILSGIMDFHGVKKDVEFNTNIKLDGNKVLMSGNGNILMTDFKIKPPKLLFLNVRDRVDLTFDLELNK